MNLLEALDKLQVCVCEKLDIGEKVGKTGYIDFIKIQILLET